MMLSSIFFYKIKNKFFSLKYLPRWTVFLIDVTLVIISNILTYSVLKFLNVSFYNTLNVTKRYLIIVIVYIFFMLVFKTYRGIIRYSTFSDGLKILYACCCSILVIFLLNFISFYFLGQYIWLFASLYINLVFTFLTLFLFRIVVKLSFENLSLVAKSENLIRAFVYGSDANAISIVTALQTEYPSRFEIIGFLDKKNRSLSIRILNIPILNLNKKISVTCRAYNAHAIIFADGSLSKIEQLKIVDECLEYNIKTFNALTISNWENHKEISKKIVSFNILDLLERDTIILKQNQILSQLKNKTILITGAAGSIGSEIVRQVILFNPKEIILLDQAETPLHYLKMEIEEALFDVKIKTVIGDVRNRESLEKVFKKYLPSVVFHAAAYKHVPMMEDNPAQAIFANILGTKNTADLSLQYKVSNFVFISTDKAVNPSNIMGASKRIAEKYIQSLFYNSKRENNIVTKFVTTRFGNVLGSNGSVVPLFTEQIQNGGPVTITHPDIIRYFMTIPEACQLVLEASAMGDGGEIFIFDMGDPVKIIDLAKKMILLAGLVPERDIEIKIVGLRPGEKLYEELLNDTSKTLPTHNSKILISEEVCNDYIGFLKEIEDLILLAKLDDTNAIVRKMKHIVPEFISMNSEFKVLDN